MNTQNGKRKMESRRWCCAHAQPSLHSAFRFPLSALRRSRHAVTLIELLITITIIATLSAAFLGASRSAMETARAARTKTTIAKIHGLLMERWASYATRRVNVDTSGLNNRELLAWVRLDATRLQMMLEMPDRWSDLLGDTVENDLPANARAMPPSFSLIRTVVGVGNYNLPMPYPSLSRAYLRRYDQLDPSDPDKIRDNQGAECLYMIIMLATGDGEARTLFSQQDIGDTDEDGAPEFLDGWGRPIRFIRWPAGFVAQSALITGDADEDHDPFDHFRRDITAYRLVPLIYSNGSDGQADLILDTATVALLNPYAQIYNVPSLGITNQFLATTINNDGDNWIDNIHNHLQDGR